MGVIVFNNQSSDELGIRVSRFPDYNIPERDYEAIHVPGKNGDVIIDKGTFSNVTRDYEISVPTEEGNFYNTIDNISKWLHSSNGYARLTDTYDPDHYRMAYYKESNTIENLFDSAGRATIKFECKPQRYYISGDTPITCSNGQVITNNTGFNSLPTVLVTIGRRVTGTVTIGRDCQITISSQNVQDSMEITINSELQDAYSGVTNCNSMISLSNGEFPELIPGDNTITFSGGVSQVKIIPRWWTI